MDEHLSKREREELIVGDHGGLLDDDQAADLPMLAELLGDPSTWAEPRAGLEDAVVRAVAHADPVSPTRPAAHRRRVVLAAAAAVVLFAVGAIAVRQGRTPAPDFEGELAATAAAPGARAEVDITRTDAGFRITLEAAGLPSLAPGEYYQAWLKDAGGTLVPVGTFSSSDDHVTLWSGASPATFPILTVTVEAIDGDQSSSGRLVLTGEVQAG